MDGVVLLGDEVPGDAGSGGVANSGTAHRGRTRRGPSRYSALAATADGRHVMTEGMSALLRNA